MEVTTRGGAYYRVADPDWGNPLDGCYSMSFGGRWNAAGGFPVTYFDADVATARAKARCLLFEGLKGQPFNAEDLDRSELPVLVTVELPSLAYLDMVSPSGCAANGLRRDVRSDVAGEVGPGSDCRPFGQQAWEAGLPGIVCHSSVEGALTEGEELVWFDRHEITLEASKTQDFDDWYGSFDW